MIKTILIASLMVLGVACGSPPDEKVPIEETVVLRGDPVSIGSAVWEDDSTKFTITLSNGSSGIGFTYIPGSLAMRKFAFTADDPVVYRSMIKFDEDADWFVLQILKALKRTSAAGCAAAHDTGGEKYFSLSISSSSDHPVSYLGYASSKEYSSCTTSFILEEDLHFLFFYLTRL
jgi:hypothetical protein